MEEEGVKGVHASRSARVVMGQVRWLHVFWRMLAYAGVCWRMLAFADVCWRMLTYAMLYAQVRWLHGELGTLLTYAYVC